MVVKDENFKEFRKAIDGSEDKTVRMTYVKKERTNKKKADKTPNEFCDLIYKRVVSEFGFGKKYSAEVKSVNPNYEFKGSKVEYTKFADNDMIEVGPDQAKSIGIVDPKTISSTYLVMEGETLRPWDTEKDGDIHTYLPPKKEPSVPLSGVVYRRYKYQGIESLSIGDTEFENADFKI